MLTKIEKRAASGRDDGHPSLQRRQKLPLSVLKLAENRYWTPFRGISLTLNAGGKWMTDTLNNSEPGNRHALEL